MALRAFLGWPRRGLSVSVRGTIFMEHDFFIGCGRRPLRVPSRIFAANLPTHTSPFFPRGPVVNHSPKGRKRYQGKFLTTTKQQKHAPSPISVVNIVIDNLKIPTIHRLWLIYFSLELLLVLIIVWHYGPRHLSISGSSDGSSGEVA